MDIAEDCPPGSFHSGDRPQAQFGEQVVMVGIIQTIEKSKNYDRRNDI